MFVKCWQDRYMGSRTLIVASNRLPMTPFLLFVLILVFGVSPVGTFWMLYMSIRHEKHPLPMIMLAFVPFASLWYYFERVRARKSLRDGRSP